MKLYDDAPEIVQFAYEFAKKAHEKQLRKYTGEPYIVHPVEVMHIVRTVPHTAAMLATALLHDVLEDTSVTESEMRMHFGDEITDMVVWLTDTEVVAGINRKERKRLDRERLSKAPPGVQTIKYADMLSNTRTISMHDPDFAILYNKEKSEMMNDLRDGDRRLLMDNRPTNFQITFKG